MFYRTSFLLIYLIASQWVAATPAAAQSFRQRNLAAPTSGAEGVLKPWKSCDVACAETGIIETISVGLGDRVEVGHAIAELDSASVRLQLQVAESQAAARGRRSSAEAEVDLQRRKVAAFEAARKQQYSSQLELERAQADLAIAEARLMAEIEEAQVLKLQVARFRQQLEERRVVAPIDGVVVRLLKEVGEYVAPTSPEIVTIVDVSRLRASFFLQESEVNRLPKHGSVRAEIAGHGRVVASVEHIAPVADPASGLVEVSILIENPNANVLGSRCTLLFDADKSSTVGR